MPYNLRSEFLLQLTALVLSVILVHSIYVILIRPNAEAIITYQERIEAEGGDHVPSRSIYIILKDYEQETAFVLMFWAMFIMGLKAFQTTKERRLLQQDILHIEEGASLLPEDARSLGRPLESLPRDLQQSLPARMLQAALQRFGATGSLQNAADSVKTTCDQEAERLESELTMVRYIAWAIPSIGFIGTVRGIGAALGQAHRAVEGDIAGVTANLGVAFNSTFVALVLSIILMFLLHQLQSAQEKLVLDCQGYADRRLLSHMQADR